MGHQNEIISEVRLQNLLASWGWKDPGEDVTAQARLSLQLQNCRSGEAVVLLGLADQETVEKLLGNKPANVLTHDWLCKHLPHLRDESQKILALSSGVQYFSNITPADVHDLVTSDGSIYRHCNSLEAILLKLEGMTPVLVFGDYLSMTKYTQMGREDRLRDPIRIALYEAKQLDNPNQLVIGVGNRKNILQVMRTLDVTDDKSGGDDIQEETWTKHKARTEAQRVLARLLDSAIEQDVTDMAIAPHRDGSGYVLFRRYGDMIAPLGNNSLDAQTLEEMARFLLSLSRANPEGGRIREPKDGQFIYKSGATEVFIRASFIPLDRSGMDLDMVSVSLRLLPRKIGLVNLSDLNMKPRAIREISKVASFSQGLIVLAGPTNSGKSTTIAGIVGEHVNLFGNSRKRLSIEDPVERYLPGVLHISVPPHMENGFANIFRAVLRHDPDVVWIGEVRDPATASTCVRAAASGHLVFTTVHANDSIGAYKEISNMIDPDKKFNLVESLSMLIAQRLVKRICPHCGHPAAPLTEKEQEVFDYYVKMQGVDCTPPAAVRHANLAGCHRCQAGYCGILPLHEILPVTRAVKDALMGTNTDGRINFHEVARHRVLTLLQSGMELVEEGQVELMDILV